jgi:hypothetical protein
VTSADDVNARALPQSSRDAGNRISFARLRGFAEDARFRRHITGAEARVQSVSLDAVSAIVDRVAQVGRAR